MGRPRLTDRPVRDCQHPKARHQHGHYLGYVADKCRCLPCTHANSRQTQTRRRLLAYGRWGAEFVDAEPVREHIARLREAGVGPLTIAARSGVSNGAVARLIWGSPVSGTPPTKRVLTRTADAILSLDPSNPALLAGGAMIDKTGTVRRVQALMAIGWSHSRLAAEIGCSRNWIAFLADDAPKIQVRNAELVKDLYDRLWDKPFVPSNNYEAGALRRRMAVAKARGWQVPLAWDDDTIDDPAAAPFEGRESRPGGQVVWVEDVEFLLDVRPHATAHQLGERLHVTRDAIQAACRRAGRQDLLDVLARNADLANPGKGNRRAA